MQANNQTAVTFAFNINGIRLQVLFYNLEQMILLFVKPQTTQHFSVVVNSDYSINPRLEHEDYIALTQMLELEFKKGNPFRPYDFFVHFAKNIPCYAATVQVDATRNIVYIAKHVEESLKTEFINFHPHNNDGKHVSTENLNKTALYFGTAEAARCKKANVSSRWRVPKCL